MLADTDIGPRSDHPPEALCKLPLFRPVALRLLQMLTNDEIEMHEIVIALRSDPAFGAEVLTLANSALYGSRTPIHSLPRAIMVLGLERVKSLTITVALQAFIRNQQHSEELERSWRHSVGSALIAEELSAQHGVSRDQAYTAGLVHDVGRLGLLAAYSKAYKALLALPHRNVADILADEERLCGTDHTQAGLWLTRSWGFPEDLWEIAARHHENEPEPGLLRLIHSACLLADGLDMYAVAYDQKRGESDLTPLLPAGITWVEFSGQIAARVRSMENL